MPQADTLSTACGTTCGHSPLTQIVPSVGASWAGLAIHGYTDNYIRVGLPYQSALANRIVRVRLGEFDGEECGADVVDDLAMLAADPAGVRLPLLNIISA